MSRRAACVGYTRCSGLSVILQVASAIHVMPRPTPQKRKSRTKRRPKSVFLNIPYDPSFTRLYIAYIAAVASFGFIPKATLQIPASRRRLDRILSLISSSDYSLHDLSRVQLDLTPPRTPRFNMPFELGLTVALQKSRIPRHSWIVLESRPHRLLKSLSDLNGTDPFIHSGTVRGLLRELSSIFVRTSRTPSVPQMFSIYRLLCSRLPSVLRSSGSVTPFNARVFADLCVLASLAASSLV
jgi:hypothetical protein